MLDGALDSNVELQHRLFAQLRRKDPIHWAEAVGHRPFWTVTKYADIIEIERQADRFINSPRTKLLGIESRAR